MNTVNLIGRITKDLELKNSSNGKKFTFFSLAVNEYSKDKQITNFVPCIAWEKTAENLTKYVKKGSQIAIEGSINVRQENNNGNFTQHIIIRVKSLQFLNNSNQQKQESKSNNNDNDSILWED